MTRKRRAVSRHRTVGMRPGTSPCARGPGYPIESGAFAGGLVRTGEENPNESVNGCTISHTEECRREECACGTKGKEAVSEEGISNFALCRSDSDVERSGRDGSGRSSNGISPPYTTNGYNGPSGPVSLQSPRALDGSGSRVSAAGVGARNDQGRVPRSSVALALSPMKPTSVSQRKAKLRPWPARHQYVHLSVKEVASAVREFAAGDEGLAGYVSLGFSKRIASIPVAIDVEDVMKKVAFIKRKMERLKA